MRKLPFRARTAKVAFTCQIAAPVAGQLSHLLFCLAFKRPRAFLEMLESLLSIPIPKGLGGALRANVRGGRPPLPNAKAFGKGA
jgi:hypothetical protein